MHPEAARATLSRPAHRFNVGASERSRLLWPGMNAALTVSSGKHARVMKEGSGWSGPAVAAVWTCANKRCCMLILLRI